MIVTDHVSDIQVIYVTCPDIEVARMISRDLIEKKLAACTNIISQVESHYVWEGNYQQEKEVVLLVKTIESQFSSVEKRVQALHPYKLPCVISLRVAQGSPAYLKWINENSKGTF